ncbi:MAG: hypothetical protein HOL15_03370 [Nitrospinaceae bacterium]|jgi:uncharacterized protein|nr:hypothetical protein [Nitrospina sp.]MBT5375834.1 hypothetical protein [Nitrospinaceae bacterium]MBT5869002.1 hypothetical protein [Nitrospinaceae bacterium]MBT6346206.1 hypothetical protein [Nitrospina sp.]
MSASPKLQLQQLILLQTLDDEIIEHNELLDDIPAQVDGGRAELEEKRKILSTAKEELDALKKKRKDLEAKVQGENDHMAKAKIKLPAVKTNKEYTAINMEVDAIKEKVSGLEDQELEIMEILEEKQKEFPGIEKIFKGESDLFQEYQANKEAELKRMKQELQVLVEKRDVIKAEIEAVVLQRYEKVLKARDGRAVVVLKENICQGCFQQILPQMAINVKVGESIQQCSNCLRFLYWDETPEAATPK